MTAVYAILNRMEGKISIVNAAHLPVIHINNKGDLSSIEPDSDLIGIFENASFNVQSMQANSGDRFYICTDGLVEAFKKARITREQGLEDLKNLCLENRHKPIQTAVREIVENIFKSRKPEDDVVLLGIEV